MYLRNSVPLKCRVEARNFIKKLVLRRFVDMKWNSLTFVARDQLSIHHCHTRRNFTLDADWFSLFDLSILLDLNDLLPLQIFHNVFLMYNYTIVGYMTL